MNKKYNTMLFVLYFFVYAISPLSYACESKLDNEQATSFRPKIFIIELLISKVKKQESKDNSPSSVNLLFKKKRVTLSSNKSQIHKNEIKKLSVIPDYFVFAEASNAAIEAQIDTYRTYIGFHHHHSGLSPPIV